MRYKVAIAGASGFIGNHLVQFLLEMGKFDIIGLSRRSIQSNTPGLTWKKCDLFSVLELERALEGVDIIVYLVHSMQPSARLDQACFQDYDLILADNIGRAAQAMGIKDIIYLSGIIPDQKKLSLHLKSRLEVEKVFESYFEQFTFLRAGLILGRNGSSYHILKNIVLRLPVLFCPKWSLNRSSPVDYRFTIESIGKVLSSRLEYNQLKIDLCAQDEISYFQLFKLMAKHLKRKRFFLLLPLSIISVSKLWVRLFSGADKELVYPLLDSLDYEMLSKNSNRLKSNFTVDTLLGRVVKEDSSLKPFKFRSIKSSRNSVRSVQRCEIPVSTDAKMIALEYMAWLPKIMFPFILVRIEKDKVFMCFISQAWRLLVLHWSPQRSSSDRQIFYIIGGVLAQKKPEGRLEFRVTKDKLHLISAIHDFIPALPWYIYRYSQALVHLLVMTYFGKHLQGIKQGKKKWLHLS